MKGGRGGERKRAGVAGLRYSDTMRLVYQILSQVVLGAIGLIVAHFAIADFTLHLAGFFTALAVFTLAQAIFSPIVMKLAERYAASLTGGVGLISTLLALWIASLFQGGIEMRSFMAWIAAPLIIWLITAIGGWLFMRFFVDKRLKRKAAEKTLGRSK